MKNSNKFAIMMRLLKQLSLLMMCLQTIATAGADIIMMGQNGQPNIVDNDDFDDVILMPGMLIYDNLIL